MEVYSGHLYKMRGRFGSQPEDPINYHLPLDELEVHLNPMIGRVVELHFSGKIHCINCGRSIRKTYSEGHCFPCTRSLASCDMCILRPEQCHYDQGTCREPDWGLANCMSDHVIYVANSSGGKVGITRNVPTRWIDQGAVQAKALFRVKKRLHAGKVEVLLKDHIADKTNWRKMLSGPGEDLDMEAQCRRLLSEAGEGLAKLAEDFGDEGLVQLKEPTLKLNYPVQTYPEKIKSLNLDKTPHISGVLNGIKGQYLIFEHGVLNVRKFTGYLCDLKFPG